MVQPKQYKTRAAKRKMMAEVGRCGIAKHNGKKEKGRTERERAEKNKVRNEKEKIKGLEVVAEGWCPTLATIKRVK